MINPLVFYGAGGALLVGLFAGWSIRDWKADADTLAAYERADKLRDEMQAKIDAGSVKYEDWRSGATERSIETRNTIREIYRNVEVPADCAPPPAAASVLQERVGAANAAATGQSGGTVSEDSKASRSSD
jgi:hypothetical protein